MFLDHFSLRDQPFGVTPDPAYLYLSRTHRSALDALSAGIRNDRGFMTVIAEPGMGKTTLLYHLLDQLRDNARTIFIFQTQCDSREFFGHLLAEFGMNPAGMDIVAMHECLNKMLFSEMLAGKRVVLVVDEAQNLAGPVLETIRLLSNFETPHAKLLQIIFAGQPQLATNLGSPALSQLRQRITVVAHLSPFRVDETAAYIQHRLKVAGYSGDGIFTANAITAIARQSEGIPRIINNLCFNAMCLGLERGFTLLDADIVGEAAAQLCLQPSTAGRGIAGGTSVPEPVLSLAAARSYTPKTALGVSRRFAAYFSAPMGRINKSWVYGTAALGVLVLIGVWGISRSFGKQVKAAAETLQARLPRPLQQAVEPTLDHRSGATPQAMTSLQFLLVAAQPNDTVKEISLRYLGRFDGEILQQISALNPELKNLNQMAPGQLLRVPFPSGTLKKVFDSDSPKSRNASADASLASLQPVEAIRRPPLSAPAAGPPANTSNELATKQAEDGKPDLPKAVSTLRPAGANVPAVQPATGGLNPTVGERPVAPPALDATAPSANSVQTAEPAELIARRDPIYPAIARTNRISGSVEMHFKISAEGKVFDAAAVKGPPLLAQAALEALQAWRYKPARLNGKPIESEAITVFDFKGN